MLVTLTSQLPFGTFYLPFAVLFLQKEEMSGYLRD
jgi:hypothetical protein